MKATEQLAYDTLRNSRAAGGWVYIYYDNVDCTGNPYARISDIIVREMNDGAYYWLLLSSFEDQFTHVESANRNASKKHANF